jgi:hypothetical protein
VRLLLSKKNIQVAAAQPPTISPAVRSQRGSSSTHPDTLIHSSARQLHFPLDIASYKLYYVNYKICPILSAVDNAWETRYPGIRLPLPPFRLLSCRLRVLHASLQALRYHVGPHSCDARHSPRPPSRLAALWKVSRTLVNFLLGRWSVFFGGAINDETLTTDSRGFATCARNPQGSTQPVVGSCVCDGFFFPEGNRGQV